MIHSLQCLTLVSAPLHLITSYLIHIISTFDIFSMLLQVSEEEVSPFELKATHESFQDGFIMKYMQKFPVHNDESKKIQDDEIEEWKVDILNQFLRHSKPYEEKINLQV